MSSSYRFPDAADAADLGTTFENLCTVLSGATDAGPRHRDTEAIRSRSLAKTRKTFYI